MTNDLGEKYLGRFRDGKRRILYFAFRNVGVDLSQDEIERLLYYTWFTWRFKHQQTPGSRRYVERIVNTTEALRSAYDDALQYERFATPSPDTSDAVGLLSELTWKDPDLDQLMTTLDKLANAGREVLACCPTNKGRPRKEAYHGFLRLLHDVYVSHTGKRGFYEKDGTAAGPFVDVAVAAQDALPARLRLKVPSTIASRILAAIPVKKTK